MIQSAFKSAYTNEVSAQNQGINNITKGVKALGTAVAMGAGIATGGLPQAIKYFGKVTGLGGFLMQDKVQEKKESAEGQKMFSEEEVQETIASSLGNNPINRSAIKTLSTVFEKLTDAKESGIINKKGKIKTSIGEFDAYSPIGVKIAGGLDNDNDR